MPRGLRKKTKQYVLDRFQEEDPEEYFKYKSKSAHGLTQDQMDFIQAIQCQSVQKIRSMLNRGVDPNFFLLRNKQTPLHLAVENKGGSDAACEKILGVMLFFGANPNAQDNEGHSPLHTACISGNAIAVELLLQAGGDANLVDNRRETPLMSTCRHLHEQSKHIVNLLLSSGALVCCTNLKNQSVLHMLTASQLNKLVPVWSSVDRHVIAETVLRHGHCANTVDDKGLSALCYELVLLLHSPQLVPHLLSTAQVLICGGAVLQCPQDQDKLESCIRNASFTISQSVANYLAPLLIDCHGILAPAQLHILSGLVKRVYDSFASEAVGKLDKQISSQLGLVPSLTQLCRLSVKQSLGGLTFWKVKYLPVPDKIKDYICCYD